MARAHLTVAAAGPVLEVESAGLYKELLPYDFFADFLDVYQAAFQCLQDTNFQDPRVLLEVALDRRQEPPGAREGMLAGLRAKLGPIVQSMQNMEEPAAKYFDHRPH